MAAAEPRSKSAQKNETALIAGFRRHVAPPSCRLRYRFRTRISSTPETDVVYFPNGIPAMKEGSNSYFAGFALAAGPFKRSIAFFASAACGP